MDLFGICVEIGPYRASYWSGSVHFCKLFSYVTDSAEQNPNCHFAPWARMLIPRGNQSIISGRTFLYLWICRSDRLFIYFTNLRDSMLGKQKGWSVSLTMSLNASKLPYEVTKWSQWITSQWVCSIKSRPSVAVGLFLLRVGSGWMGFFCRTRKRLLCFCFVLLFFTFFMLNSYLGKLICICGQGIQQYFLSVSGHSLVRRSKGTINSSCTALVWTQSSSTDEDQTLISHFW